MIELKDLKQLMTAVQLEMKNLNYAEASIKHYVEIWNRYLKETDYTVLDKDDLRRFLKNKYGITENMASPSRYQRTAIRAMNVLVYYSNFQKIYIRFPLFNPVVKKTPFDSVVDGFLDSLKNSGYASTTIHTHERVIKRFVLLLMEDGVSDISDICTSHITSFILEITGHRGRVSYELNSLRVFFRYLYRNKLHPYDMTLFIPAANHLRSREHLPSVWTEEDIRKILDSIDTGNPVGKRDYAMILLAVRLGLRGSDIKNLRFKDIDWEKESITITQVKTKEPLVLPLFEDVGKSLIDYLKNSRPKSNLPYVFLSLKAPYRELSKENHLHQILNKYMLRSGIKVTPEKSHGMHSIRHSLASELLKQGTPLPIISGILGHKNTHTTSEYLRIDLEQLKFCTLSPEVGI